MDERTLEALRGSIAKWRGIAARKKQDDGIDNCPLCRLFHPYWTDNRDCGGCPVKHTTGKDFCAGTPYEEWVENDGHKVPAKGKRGHVKMKRIARSELAFLKSLLPAKP